jgi:hypothetical protein
MCVGYFPDKVSGTIYWAWLRNAILLISASWVDRITGVSHWCPADISRLEPRFAICKLTPSLEHYKNIGKKPFSYSHIPLHTTL